MDKPDPWEHIDEMHIETLANEGGVCHAGLVAVEGVSPGCSLFLSRSFVRKGRGLTPDLHA